jgi:hypothetical protein
MVYGEIKTQLYAVSAALSGNGWENAPRAIAGTQ